MVAVFKRDAIAYDKRKVWEKVRKIFDSSGIKKGNNGKSKIIVNMGKDEE